MGVADIIANVVNQNTLQDSTLIKQGQISTWFRLNYYAVDVQLIEAKLESKDLAEGGFVVGNPALSIVGTTKIGAGSTAFSVRQTITNPNSGYLHDVGVTQLAKWFAGDAPDRPGYFAHGSGSTAVSLSQTALVTEEVRATTDVVTVTETSTDTVTLSYEIASDGTPRTFREMGLFDADAAGNMWTRVLFTAYSINATTTIRMSLKFKIVPTNTTTSIITDVGLDRIRDFIGAGSAIFGYTEISDGTAALDVTDTSLDGSNKDRNAVAAATRNGNSVEVVTSWTTAEFNTYTMGKIGSFIGSGVSTDLFAESLLSGQTKADTFKFRNVDVFDISTGI
jgi:hypothetical protein